MASAIMDEDGPRCGYCMQALTDMTDPRKLPCDHIFCLECLQNDYTAGGDTKCTQCGEMHEGLVLNDLPEAGENSDQSGEEESKLHPITCSRDCNEDAMCFCLQCSFVMCSEHKKAHDTFLTKHMYVPFDEYRRLPQKYESPICMTHGSNLTLACEECDALVCQESDLTSPCGQPDKQHKFQSLAKSERRFTDDYRKLIEKVSDQHSTFSKKQKDTEASFGNLVDHYNLEEKLKEVDRVAQLQIAEIKRRAEMRKRGMEQFPNLMDLEYSAYSKELLGKEQQLDGLHKSLSKQMREMHITDVIRENKGNREQIDVGLELETGNCGILREMVAAPTGNVPDIGIELRPLLPTSLLKFFSSSSLGKKAQLLTVTDRGDLLYYYENKVQLFDTHCKKVKFNHKVNAVVSLAQQHDQVFITTNSNNYLKCMRMSTDLNSKEETQIFYFRTEHPPYQKAQMIVKGAEVIVIDNTSYSYSLKIYDLSGTHLRTVKLREHATQICNLPGCYVLLQNLNEYIGKYDISSSSAVEVWLSKESTSNVSTDSVGLCYGVNRTDNARQQMSFYWGNGTKIDQEVTLEERKHIQTMDVNNNIMSVIDNNGYIQLYYVEF